MPKGRAKQDRRSRRAPVLLAATIEIAGGRVPVRLRNISETGALIEGDCLPIEGTKTRFERNKLSVECRIVWVRGRFAGLAFAHALNREEVLRHIPASAPRRPDEADYRRPGFSSRPLTEHERKMLESWAAPGVGPE